MILATRAQDEVSPDRREFGLKRFIAKLLRYDPLIETAPVREAIEAARTSGRPFCPPYEGDLIYALVRAAGARRCLEMGFHTGSTALYMDAGLAQDDGQVTSVGLDSEEDMLRGRKLLRDAGAESRHRLLRENSNRVVPELFLAGEKFDFVFMDGWKTFDHLAFEIYFINRMLEKGGFILFDDSYMPSVRQAIRLLKRYYGYAEIDYGRYGQTRRLGLYLALAHRTPHRPYRALAKTVDTADQTPTKDWNFYRPL